MKCDDSYVYLSAISVLAALGDSFPDLVLNTLADEYVNGCKDMFANDYETRIKLGEVLLRVVRSLGKICSTIADAVCVHTGCGIFQVQPILSQSTNHCC